jgi:hypothetical protein
MSDTAVVEQSQPVVVPEPVSPERKAATDMIEGFEGRSVAPGGDQWDGSRWVNTTARDAKGRFAKITESLEQGRKLAEYVQLAKAGAIEPLEEHDSETWLALRQAQIDAGMDRISVPESFTAEEKPAEKENANDSASAELTEQEVKHFTNYKSMLTNVAAKMAIDGGATTAALDGLSRAHREYGVPPEEINYLGIALADCDNSHEVLLALGRNPDVVARYTQLGPQGMREAVLARCDGSRKIVRAFQKRN